jgi:branched-chain amino acid transport system permease protein
LTDSSTTGPAFQWQWLLQRAAVYIVVVGVIISLPLFVSGYVRSMIIKSFIFGIFALSLNLLWGYTGLFSLGHAVYFGVGGYTAGILIVHYGIHNFWMTAAAGILMATLLASALAIPALRMAGAYFLLVTLAMGELIASVAEKWRSITRGGDGLVGIPYPDLHIPGLTMNSLLFYYMVLVVFVICVFLIYRIVKSSFGEALQGIRENEPRMHALGYNTWLYQYIAFIVGGFFAGVAGVLFGHFTGMMHPGHVGVMTSTLAMLMVILGGPNMVFGPVLGAAVMVVLEQTVSIYAPERWPLILGAVFVLAVLFLRGGISVHLCELWSKLTHGSVTS